MESCGMNVIKYLLFIFNLIFAISGIGILVAGGIALSDAVDYEYFDESGSMGPAIVLVVAGSIVFIVAFFGCFGAIRESYCMLMTFAVFLLIIFFLELAGGIAAAAAKHELTEDKLRTSFTNYASENKDKAAWDNLQSSLKCCGVKDNSDWASQFPSSCCTGDMSDETAENQICLNQHKMQYIYTKGCYEKLKMGFSKNSKALIGVGIGIAFIEIVGIVLACWLASVIKRESGDETK